MAKCISKMSDALAVKISKKIDIQNIKLLIANLTNIKHIIMQKNNIMLVMFR
jgi:hypothetical protein